MNYLINPNDVIDYNRSVAELELFWLFCAVVAGKTATTQARLLQGFLEGLEPTTEDTPFGRIRLAEQRGVLFQHIIDSRLGQYNRLYKLMTDSLSLDLKSCTVEQLENIHGCGPKTARMFIMMSRPNQRLAALDTHVLKHLRENNIDAPLATPPAGSRYKSLEIEFLKLADRSGQTVAEYDLSVWKTYANR